MRHIVLVTLAAALTAVAAGAQAGMKFFAYNMTTSSDFIYVYMAPAGSNQWGPNQAVNDLDQVFNITERLPLTGLQPGAYDVKLVDSHGRTCIKRNVVLGQERSFEIRDFDLGNCR